MACRNSTGSLSKVSGQMSVNRAMCMCGLNGSLRDFRVVCGETINLLVWFGFCFYTSIVRYFDLYVFLIFLFLMEMAVNSYPQGDCSRYGLVGIV